MLPVTVTFLLITKLFNRQVSGISSLDYAFPNTAIIMDFCAFYIYQINCNDKFLFSSLTLLVIMFLVIPVLLISLVSKTSVTFPSVYYLPNWIFLVTVFFNFNNYFLKVPSI